ncbi:unnamed protein product [Wickerhamomyces anomalus]
MRKFWFKELKEFDSNQFKQLQTKAITGIKMSLAEFDEIDFTHSAPRLDRPSEFNYTPCGFCFVLYKNPQDAINAVKYLADTKLEDRLVQIDLDPGFREGRQFGRGASGGQVKDEYKFEYDSSRGGFGVNGTGLPPVSIIPDGNEVQRFGARRNNFNEKDQNLGDSYVPGEENNEQDVEVNDENHQEQKQEQTAN